MRAALSMTVMALMGSSLWAAEPLCSQSQYRISATNVSREPMTGYLQGNGAVGFSAKPGDTLQLEMRATPGRQEYRNQVTLMGAEGPVQCREYVLIPSGCPGAATAANLYLYQANGKPHCFMRSVVRPAKRGTERLAMKR